MFVRNVDVDSKPYEAIKTKPRPGHADLAYWLKFGHIDHRGGGRGAARETVGRVAAGAIAKKLLAATRRRDTGPHRGGRRGSGRARSLAGGDTQKCRKQSYAMRRPKSGRRDEASRPRGERQGRQHRRRGRAHRTQRATRLGRPRLREARRGDSPRLDVDRLGEGRGDWDRIQGYEDVWLRSQRSAQVERRQDSRRYQQFRRHLGRHKHGHANRCPHRWSNLRHR